jgi:CheY-like chemotaxis protein
VLAPLVLIVDDYDDNRAVYSEYMRSCGYRVAEARDGQEAIEKALALAPDVIVMDMYLPGLDGWHATEEIKNKSATCDIAVIAFSADSSDDNRKKAEDAGCCQFLEKPCAPTTLLGAVREVLGSSAGRH